MEIKELYARYETEAARSCAKFLKPILLKIAPKNWWETRVLDKLNEHQKKEVGKSIESLDLAKLLTVFNSNWDDIFAELIKEHKKLKWRDRSNISKMMDFRNHSSHFPVGGLPTEIIMSDLSVLWQFMEIVEADEKIIQEIKNINKQGSAHDFDENVLDQIINSKKQKPEKKTKEKKVKETIPQKSEKPARTGTDTIVSKKKNEEKSKGNFAYIISNNGINLFQCTRNEIKKKIFAGEIKRDYNICEAGSTVAAPGPEIGDVSGFAEFFDELERKQEEERQKEIAKEERRQRELLEIEFDEQKAEEEKKRRQIAKQERKIKEELRQKEFEQQRIEEKLVRQEKWDKNKRIIIPLIVVGTLIIIASGAWLPILIVLGIIVAIIILFIIMEIFW